MMNFNAAVIREKGGTFAIECVAIDEPRGREVLVRIASFNLWRQGRFPFDKLIRKYALSDIDKAAHDSESGTVLKAVLIPELA